MVSGRTRGGKLIIQTLIVLAIIVVVNLISRQMYTYVDLTEDKRFTLSESTASLLEDVDDVVFIEVLLEGDLDANLKRLQNRTREILAGFNNINPNIEYSFINPSEGTTEEINMLAQNLAKDGIRPGNLMIQEANKLVEKLFYPYVIIKYGDRKIPVNLMEPQMPNESNEQTLNRSGTLLEYKLANAMQKMFAKDFPIVMFTEGNGELIDAQTARLEQELARTVRTGRLNLDSTFQIDQKVDVLIVARPTEEVSVRSQFLIDQYIMNGGKVIWMIDQYHLNLDSISYNKVYIPRPMEHGLDNLFFKYGVRINTDLILDLENTKIPQVIGTQGGKEQTQYLNWIYHPLLQANSDNPIVKNIGRVASTFPSSITILDNKKKTDRSILLTSSRYSRFQKYPMRLSFEVMRMEQKPEAYNKSFLPAAVLLEGEFESFFKNRVSPEMNQGLKQIDAEFKERSPKTSQIFVADGGLIKNLYDASSNRISSIGFNKWEQKEYPGNKEFIINAIEYLLDDYGLIESRSKSVKLRLLDQVELQNNKAKWQMINILGPLLLVLLFGLLFNFWRRRKYSQ